ncbi:MAG: hypothetical protein ACRCY4_00175, partial [Brevinema sp.]
MIRAALSALMMLAGLFLAYGAVVFNPEAVGFLSSEGATPSLFNTIASRFAEPFILYYGAGVWLWALTLIKAGPTLIKGLDAKTLLIRFLSVHAAAFSLGLLTLLVSGDLSYQMGGTVGVLLGRKLMSLAPAMVWVPFTVVLFFLALNGASSVPYKIITALSRLFKMPQKSQEPQPVLADNTYNHTYMEDLDDSFEPNQDEPLPYVQSQSVPFAEETPRAKRVVPNDVPSFLKETHVDLIPQDFAYEPPSNHFYEVVDYNTAQPLPAVDDTLIELDDAPKDMKHYQFISDPENFDETDGDRMFRIPAVQTSDPEHRKTTPVPHGLYHVSPLATLTIDPELPADEAPADPYLSRRMDNLTIERDGERLPPIKRAVENASYVTSFAIEPQEGTVSTDIFAEEDPSTLTTLPLEKDQPKNIEPIIIAGENRAIDPHKIILPPDLEHSPRVFAPPNELTPEEIELINQADQEQQKHLEEVVQLKRKLAAKMELLTQSYQGNDENKTINAQEIAEMLYKLTDSGQLTSEEIELINQADQVQQKHLEEATHLKQKLAAKMEELSKTYQVGASYHAFNPDDVVDFLDDEIAALRQPNAEVKSTPQATEEDAMLEDFIIPNPGEDLSEAHIVPKIEEPSVDELAPDTLPAINYHSDANFAPFPADSLPEVNDLPPINDENQAQESLVSINDRINLDELLQKAVYVPQAPSFVSEETPDDDLEAISFGDIVSTPPIFDENSTQDDTFAHIDPLNNALASESLQAPAEPVIETPRQLSPDYFYQPEANQAEPLIEDHTNTMPPVIESLQAPAEPLIETPRQLSPDYFYQPEASQ